MERPIVDGGIDGEAKIDDEDRGHKEVGGPMIASVVAGGLGRGHYMHFLYVLMLVVDERRRGSLHAET